VVFAPVAGFVPVADFGVGLVAGAGLGGGVGLVGGAAGLVTTGVFGFCVCARAIPGARPRIAAAIHNPAMLPIARLEFIAVPCLAGPFQFRA
jgi:hypothetical protein